MGKKKKILFLAQHYITLYAFRRELIEKLCADGCEVYLSLPASEDNQYFENLGCHIIVTEIDRRGVNPLNDLKLLSFYKKIIPKIDPDIIFSYTIKPNIYGSIAINGKKRKNAQCDNTSILIILTNLQNQIQYLYMLLSMFHKLLQQWQHLSIVL